MRDSEDSKTDELLTMLEELQDENESLQRQISEAQWTISQLSSANSELKKELQRKSNTIVSLNEKIEMWSVSDLVLKQNEQLKLQNSELQLGIQRIKKEAGDTISAAKREYAEKQEALDRQLCQVSLREQRVRAWEAGYKHKVVEEANRITEMARLSAKQEYRRKTEKSEKKYKRKYDAIHGVTIGSLLYCSFVTILTACKSVRFVKDFLTFLDAMWQFIASPGLLAVDACGRTWRIKDMIPTPVLGITVAVILVIFVFAVITGLIYGLIGFAIYNIAKFYHEEFWDMVSGIVALVSMGVLVWFADILDSITCNLILVWVLIHCAYLLIRMIVTSSKVGPYR